MRYLKTLGLATIATFVLMAIMGADSGSATRLTAPAGTVAPSGTTIEAESEGHTVLDWGGGNIECVSTIEGVTANSGGSIETVDVLLTTLSFSSCTNGTVVNVLGEGLLKSTASLAPTTAHLHRPAPLGQSNGSELTVFSGLKIPTSVSSQGHQLPAAERHLTSPQAFRESAAEAVLSAVRALR